MKRHLLLLLCIVSISVFSQELMDSTNTATIDTAITEMQHAGIVLDVCDTPNDDGTSITIKWDTNDSLKGYLMDIHRIHGECDTAITLGMNPLKGIHADNMVHGGINYMYYALFKKDDIVKRTDNSLPVKAIGQWFNNERFDSFLVFILIALSFAWFIYLAKKGKSFYIRKIAGLDAVEEAVGRSTEMGKPIMYLLGIGYVTDIPTIAGLTILGRVAKKAAEYDTRIMVPSYDPVVMTTAQEVVKEAFTEAGRPDAYRKEDTMYITQDQFGYAAGVDGMMMREKPGAIFLQGLFFAESLILAETGYSIGAIQIAGTTETAQLPFFVAACDYTLIGEEMMAASVYLEREPLMLGSIVAEDLIKVSMGWGLIIGFILGLLGHGFKIGFFTDMFEWLIRII